MVLGASQHLAASLYRAVGITLREPWMERCSGTFHLISSVNKLNLGKRWTLTRQHSVTKTQGSLAWLNQAPVFIYRGFWNCESISRILITLWKWRWFAEKNELNHNAAKSNSFSQKTSQRQLYNMRTNLGQLWSPNISFPIHLGFHIYHSSCFWI